MSPGLLRARQPFRLRNAITGLILCAFGVGIWAYSMGAVKQDMFDDADEEARRLAAGAADVKSLEDQEREMEAQVAQAHAEKVGAGVASVKPVVPVEKSAVTPPPPPQAAAVAPVVVTSVIEAAAVPVSLVTPSKAISDRPRGVVAALLYEHYPQLLDPKTKTVLWGAPSVDNIGKLREVSSRK